MKRRARRTVAVVADTISRLIAVDRRTLSLTSKVGRYE